MEREFRTISTRYGDVDVKIAKLNGKISNVMPEYEQVKLLATKNNVPFREVQHEVLFELERRGLAVAASE